MIPAIVIIALLASVAYALYIFNRTIPPHWVWLSVVAGSLMYDVTLGPLLYFLVAGWTQTGYLSLIFLPFGWHVLWGTPMIIFELKKHFGLSGEAIAARRPRWRGKGFLD